jgi:hypothetical protein
MKCIFNIGKNISIWAKVTQVSDVAHGPLVSVIEIERFTIFLHNISKISDTRILINFYMWIYTSRTCGLLLSEPTDGSC